MAVVANCVGCSGSQFVSVEILDNNSRQIIFANSSIYGGLDQWLVLINIHLSGKGFGLIHHSQV
jgi:hypothetical protein